MSIDQPRGSVTSRAARDVVASTSFEGTPPSPEAVRLAERVIAGEISADEAIAERLGKEGL